MKYLLFSGTAAACVLLSLAAGCNKPAQDTTATPGSSTTTPGGTGVGSSAGSPSGALSDPNVSPAGKEQIRSYMSGRQGGGAGAPGAPGAGTTSPPGPMGGAPR